MAIQFNTAAACLRFIGFYDSDYVYYFDTTAEMVMQDATTEEDGNTLKLYEENEKAFYDAFAEYSRKVAEDVVQVFEAYIEETFGQGVQLRFVAIDSPREYNFRTDMLDITYNEDALRALYSREDVRADFAEFVRVQLMPRSGFAPYYSNRLEEWEEFGAWDSVQRSLLIECVSRGANAFFLSERERAESDFISRHYDQCQEIAFNVMPQNLFGGAE